ncbi:hypothetical protein [Actinomadura gamaensis]|uniref:Uncharacterized protein n=1 Tax=Actinomadura gamaensis TaxID=1763541 RepID=A0ABV9U062_9ACTN
MTITVVLSLLCLAIAGRELYLAFDRRRTGVEPQIADMRTQIAALKDAGDEVARLRADHGERLDSLALEQLRTTGTVADLDERARALNRRVDDRIAPELAALRRHLVARLDQAVAASLGADPVDTVAGALRGDAAALAPAYERFVTRYGMRVELTDERNGIVRHYLSGRSPRGLERDFIDLLRILRADIATGPASRHLTATRPEPVPDTRPETAPPRDARPETAPPPDAHPAPAPHVRAEDAEEAEKATRPEGAREPSEPARVADGGDVAAARRLLSALRDVGPGGAQVGPLVLVRTPNALLCGVLPLAELRTADADPLADPASWTERLRRLPPGRFCDATATTAL